MARGYGPKKHDKQAFVTRTGSRATVPSARGHFRGLAPKGENEQLTSAQEDSVLVRKQKQLEAELRELKQQAKRRLSPDERRNWLFRREQLVLQIEAVRKRQLEKKDALGHVSKRVFHKSFHVCAMQMLDKETYRKIKAAAYDQAKKTTAEHRAKDVRFLHNTTKGE